ncbi:MAG: hypothetical protein ACO28P_01345 [Ilumatobacteraceae bacterium]
MRSADAIIKAAVRKSLTGSVSLRFAEVKAVSGRTVTIDFDGTLVPRVPCLKSYTPTVGDRAWLLYQDSTIVAIGCS